MKRRGRGEHCPAKKVQRTLVRARLYVAGDVRSVGLALARVALHPALADHREPGVEHHRRVQLGILGVRGRDDVAQLLLAAPPQAVILELTDDGLPEELALENEVLLLRVHLARLDELDYRENLRLVLAIELHCSAVPLDGNGVEGVVLLHLVDENFLRRTVCLVHKAPFARG